jgi:two-component sensor histidine kinase
MINSLQVLESLHALYCDRRMKSAPEDISRNLILKLQAMGHVYRDALGRNGVGRVRMTECLAKMLNDVSEMFGPLPLEVAVRGDEILLSIPEAINCGIIASEVMHNAISHGFPPGFAGKMVIRVEVRKGRDGGIEISIDDNGVGLEGKDPEADDDAIGWTLIRTLANQLGGVVGFSSSPRGMSMTLRFPEKGPSIRT